jgi:hypothetical protein
MVQRTWFPEVLVGSGILLRRHVPANLAAFRRWYADPEIARPARYQEAPMRPEEIDRFFEVAHFVLTEDDPALDRSVARDVVAAAADRQSEPELACSGDGGRDVPDPGGPDERDRTPVDHRVPDRPRVLVALVAGSRDRSLDPRSKRRQRVHRPSSSHAACEHCTHLIRTSPGYGLHRVRNYMSRRSRRPGLPSWPLWTGGL